MEYIFFTKALAPAYPKVPGKKNWKTVKGYHLTMIEVCNGGSRHTERGVGVGGGGSPRPWDKGKRSQKKFPPFRPPFGLKIRGREGPRAPSLDPPPVLETFRFEDEDEDEIGKKVFFAHQGILESLTLHPEKFAAWLFVLKEVRPSHDRKMINLLITCFRHYDHFSPKT